MHYPGWPARLQREASSLLRGSGLAPASSREPQWPARSVGPGSEQAGLSCSVGRGILPCTPRMSGLCPRPRWLCGWRPLSSGGSSGLAITLAGAWALCCCGERGLCVGAGVSNCGRHSCCPVDTGLPLSCQSRATQREAGWAPHHCAQTSAHCGLLRQLPGHSHSMRTWGLGSHQGEG